MTFARRFLTGFRETETNQPGLELNEDGTVDLVNPDGSRTPLAGGGGSSSAVQTHGYYSGPSTSVPNFSSADLPLGSFHTGDDLLDVTDPGAPVVIDAGVYAITALTQPSVDMTAGGIYTLSMEFDSDGDDQSFALTLEGTAGLPRPPALLAFTYYIPAGGLLRFQAVNLDGVQSISFALAIYVQRIS